jgi:hypothetical protein
MIRFVITTVISLLIAFGVYHFAFQKSGNEGLNGQNPSQTVQGAKDAVQQDTNIQNRVKSTVQNQYGQ